MNLAGGASSVLVSVTSSVWQKTRTGGDGVGVCGILRVEYITEHASALTWNKRAQIEIIDSDPVVSKALRELFDGGSRNPYGRFADIGHDSRGGKRCRRGLGCGGLGHRARR